MKSNLYLSSQIVLATIFLLVLSNISRAQEVEAVQVRDSIHMLTGKGGNVGVITGEDGTFMVDDQFSQMTDRLLMAIKSVGGDRPLYVINTHFHGDHTGGNENLGKLGSTLVSHDNVRKTLLEGTTIEAFGSVVAPYPEKALPQITYSTDTTFHLNEETIHVFHVPNAHTHGDSVVHFKKANVIHTGDIFFNGFYPFIDVSNGGSLKGMIAATDTILDKIDEDTKIIPGHGPLATREALHAYRDMLSTALQRLSELKANGKNATQAAAENPLADLEPKWGGGFLPGNKWISIVYESF